MGSITRQNRAERFIKEFEGDILSSWAMSLGCCVAHRSLGFNTDTDMVHIFYGIERNGSVHELMDPMVCFNPEGDRGETVEMVCGLLQIEKDVAEKRLRKAKLFS